MTTNVDYDAKIKKVTDIIVTKLKKINETPNINNITIDLRLSVENDDILIMTQDKIHITHTTHQPEGPETDKFNPPIRKQAWGEETYKPITESKKIPGKNEIPGKKAIPKGNVTVKNRGVPGKTPRSKVGGDKDIIQTLLLIPRVEKNVTKFEDLNKELSSIISNLINWYINTFTYRIIIILNGEYINGAFNISSFVIKANYDDFSILDTIMNYDYTAKNLKRSKHTEFDAAFKTINTDIELRKIILRIFSDEPMYQLYMDENTDYKYKNKDNTIQRNKTDRQAWIIANILKPFNLEQDTKQSAAILLELLVDKLHGVYVQQHAKLTSRL